MSITLLQLLNKANEGYPEGFLARMYNHKTGKPLPPRDQVKKGDGLAMFVVNELASTYSEDAIDGQVVSEALRTIDKAISDLVSTRQTVKTLWHGHDE